MMKLCLLLQLALTLLPGIAGATGELCAPYRTGVGELLPGASELVETRPFDYEIRDRDGRLLGRLLLEPFGEEERAMGYAGTIPVALCLDARDRAVGVLPGPNQETPRYLKKLAENRFFERWNGLTLEQIAGREVDAVTGATFSSEAIRYGVRKLAERHLAATPQSPPGPIGEWLWPGVLLLGAAGYLLYRFRRGAKGRCCGCHGGGN